MKNARFSFKRLSTDQLQCLSGSYQIEVSVAGFWSNPITIRMRREYDAPVWHIEVSHSSGGFEATEDSMQSNENFALAYLAAINYARELQSEESSKMLEDAYQSYYQRMLEHEKARKATKA